MEQMDYNTFVRTFTNIPLNKFPKGYKTLKQKRGLNKLLVHWTDVDDHKKENKELQEQCKRKDKVIEELKRKLGVMTGTAEAQHRYLSDQAKKLGKRKRNTDQDNDKPTPRSRIRHLNPNSPLVNTVKPKRESVSCV